MPEPPCACGTHSGVFQCTERGTGPYRLSLPDGTLVDEGAEFSFWCIDAAGWESEPWTGTFVVPEASGVAMLVAGCLMLAVLRRERG